MPDARPEATKTKGPSHLSNLWRNANLSKSLETAWNQSRSVFGHILTAHVPGMFVVNGRRGGYRAVSITGPHCELQCEHCKGILLKSMCHARDGASLKKIALDAYYRGDKGILISGGCDNQGRLPWHRFLADISYLKRLTDLTITVHTGLLDARTARQLKDAGVDQALIDIIGDDTTASKIYHLSHGVEAIRRSLEHLSTAGVTTVPHIIFGLHYGREKGEQEALNMLGDYLIEKYVVVVFMPLSGTPMESVRPPDAERVAEFITKARLKYPNMHASLGCARPRGNYRKRLDLLAIEAGVNAIALPSDEALEYASRKGLNVVFRDWCCSLG